MNKPTIEELLLQILSTCLLVNAQGKWHAHFQVSAHVGWVDVYIQPADTDYQDTNRPHAANKYAIFTETPGHPHPDLTEDGVRQSLMELLAWAQSHLSMEAAA